MGFQPFPYVGGISPRNEVETNVAEGAHDENVVSIEPHNEMAYLSRFPKVRILQCKLRSVEHKVQYRRTIICTE